MKMRQLLLTALLSLISLTNISAQTSEIVKKKLYVPKAGTLVELLTEDEANSITHLTLHGKLNAIDFRHMRNEFKNLQWLDISGASISTYAGKAGTYPEHFYVYPTNCIPAYAFCQKDSLGNYHGKETLHTIYLSDKIKNIEDYAFKACNNLRVCHINRKNAPNLMKEALNDSVTAIFVPHGNAISYRSKEKWKDFAILEGDATTLHLDIDNQSSLANELVKNGIQPVDVEILHISGKLDAADFKLIRDYMPYLIYIDMEESNATEIPEYTFTQKKFLLKCNLPKGLKRIGQRAFSGCTRLGNELVLPASVTAIEFGAFMDCERLLQVIATGGNIITLGDKLFGENDSKLIYK